MVENYRGELVSTKMTVQLRLRLAIATTCFDDLRSVVALLIASEAVVVVGDAAVTVGNVVDANARLFCCCYHFW